MSCGKNFGPAEISVSIDELMTHPTTLRLPATWLVIAGMLASTLLGCSASWVQEGDACVIDRGEGTVQRVENYSDPELCERSANSLSKERVRVDMPEEN